VYLPSDRVPPTDPAVASTLHWQLSRVSSNCADRVLAQPTGIAYKDDRGQRIGMPRTEEHPIMTGGWRSPGAAAWAAVDPEKRYGPDVALVIVDLQNDFADPAGSLSVGGGSTIVPLVNAEIERALTAGAAVAYTQDWHPPHTPHFAQDGGIWPVHCVQDTWGAELHPDLTMHGPIVRKGSHGEDGYSGFSMRNPAGGLPVPTELDETLARGGARRLVVCGLATDYCVKATALDGVRLGYETAVLIDAIRAVDLKPGDGNAALEAMTGAGVTLIGARPAG
jgi:nicotinamidase/pyrazinamidase